VRLKTDLQLTKLSFFTTPCEAAQKNTKSTENL